MTDIVERLKDTIINETPARYPEVIRAAIAEIERLRAYPQPTISVLRYFYTHSPERTAEARKQLRRTTESDRYKTDDDRADVILECIWNTLVGH